MPSSTREAELKQEIRKAKLRAKMEAEYGTAGTARAAGEIERLKRVARREKLQTLAERMNVAGERRSPVQTRVELRRQVQGVRAQIRALKGVAQ